MDLPTRRWAMNGNWVACTWDADTGKKISPHRNGTVQEAYAKCYSDEDRPLNVKMAGEVLTIS